MQCPRSDLFQGCAATTVTVFLACVDTIHMIDQPYDDSLCHTMTAVCGAHSAPSKVPMYVATGEGLGCTKQSLADLIYIEV